MQPQRLPIVDSDDGVWGDIIRQYLMKEHFNDDTDNADNGGHQKITIKAGTATAGTAPLKFTSGTLLSSPEAGAIEFAGDHYYATQTSGSTRKKIAIYNDASGATGDIYYRDSGGYFTRLGAGTSGDILTIASGIPAWTASIVGKAIDADTNTISNLEVDNFKASAIVTASEGITSNDNDTTIPTSAAVKAYADSVAGGLTVTSIKTSNYTAAAGEYVQASSEFGSITITFPTTPADGAAVAVRIAGAGIGNTITIAAGGTAEFSDPGSGITSQVIFDFANTMIYFSEWQYVATGNYWTVTNVYRAVYSGEIIDATGTGVDLLTASSPTAARTTLGLGTIATAAAPAGTVVGTSDTQVLTGKTINGGSNTLTNIALSSLATTGTASISTFLRGDGNWASVSGTGDASTNTSTSVDSEVALFSGTAGKTLKRATGSGIATLTSGVLGTTAAPLGAIVGTSDTQTLTNKTLTEPQVNNYTEGIVAIGTVTTTSTISLTNGTIQTATLTASTACTFTMPTAVAGKSFTMFLKQAASTGLGTATFTGVKWPGATAPTISPTAGQMDILTFTSDGTNWYGTFIQGFTP